MRLILSTILAAALVFGGTLLFAHYFGSIEVVRPTEPPGPIMDPSGEVDEDRGIFSYCPAVDRILAGQLPEIFEVSEEDLALFMEGTWVSEGDFTYYEKGTEWGGVWLGHLFEVGDKRVKGKTISCTYRNPRRAKSMSLTLIPDLYGEIELNPGVESGWHRGVGLDCAAPSFGCYSLHGECGFYVRQTDSRIREIKTRDDEPCWPWGEPPAPPVEQGGRTSDG